MVGFLWKHKKKKEYLTLRHRQNLAVSCWHKYMQKTSAITLEKLQDDNHFMLFKVKLLCLEIVQKGSNLVLSIFWKGNLKDKVASKRKQNKCS